MKQKYWALGVALIILVVGVYFILNSQDEDAVSLEDAESLYNGSEMRLFTFNNCQNLTGKDTFEGKVIFETCNKNCLGGCPNSGPSYCFYAVQDGSNCLVYVKSQVKAYGDERFKSAEKVFNGFKLNQQVKLNGNISIYDAPYCGLEGTKSPTCAYFVIGDVV